MTWQCCHLNPALALNPAERRPQTPTGSQLQLQICLNRPVSPACEKYVNNDAVRQGRDSPVLHKPHHSQIISHPSSASLGCEPGPGGVCVCGLCPSVLSSSFTDVSFSHCVGPGTAIQGNSVFVFESFF